LDFEISGHVIMEPSPVELCAGSSSDDLRFRATLKLTGEARAFKGEERAFLSTATVGA
jgi:hypothetical protein